MFKDEVTKAFYDETAGNGTLHNVSENADGTGLYLVLDRNLLFRGDWKMEHVNNIYPDEKFTLSLNNFMDIVNDEVNEIKIYPGYETEIKVTASRIKSDNVVRSYPIEDRKCRFSDEWADVMKIFNF